MLKDSSARRGLAVLFVTLIILALDLLFAPVHAADAPTIEKPVASLIVVECDKVVGFVLTDSQGNIVPVPLEGTTLSFVNSVLSRVPEGHRIQATLPCKQGTDT
jgi:hypothetical protein